METKVVKKDFKKGISVDENRRRREASAMAIRKDKKEESISKMRRMGANSDVVAEVPVSSIEASNPSVVASSKTPQDIPTLLRGLTSTELSVQVASLRGFRRLLSAEKNPPVQQCIDAGVIPMFTQFLQAGNSEDLQFEAAWALTNIASTDKTHVIVEFGAVPHLVQLLNSGNPDIREQSAWCLGNVAGDSAALRDIVLGHGALMPLVANVSQPASLALLRNCTWSLSNFCRGKPQPTLPSIIGALPVLGHVLTQNCDQEAMIDATWALSYVSDGDNSRIQAVVDLNVITVLIQMLTTNIPQAIIPALRTLGNIVSGNDSQTQAVMNANVLQALAPLLAHPKKNIRKETCWMLSNIAAGNLQQMSQLVATPDLLPKILEQLSAGSEWDVRKEAAWIISNIATGGKTLQCVHLVEQGAVGPLCDLLGVGEVKILMLAMEALEALLKAATDETVKLVDECGGIDKLESLQEHENEEIYKKAVHIIEAYFGTEDEELDDSENIAPQATGNTFSFGLPVPPLQASVTKPFDFQSQQQQQQQPFGSFAPNIPKYSF